MVKPKRTAVFLGRPLSVAEWSCGKERLPECSGGPSTCDSAVISFLIAQRGRGTVELGELRPGDDIELTGPLGNAWADFLPEDTNTKIALAGGGIGVAPLIAFAAELGPAAKAVRRNFDFYAGFKRGFRSDEERNALLGPALSNGGPGKLVIAAEDGAGGLRGRITDFLPAKEYAAVFACGPEPMLRTAAELCRSCGVPCFVSTERRMACGTGACLSCTVITAEGNRRCCADGPIFDAHLLYGGTA